MWTDPMLLTCPIGFIQYLTIFTWPIVQDIADCTVSLLVQIYSSSFSEQIF